MSLFNITHSNAIFSPCQKYRYELLRQWGTGMSAMFIGLNPSTADATTDDPTIRRCIRFAQSWGCTSMVMANLFAFRATDPQAMKAETEPVGEDNRDTIFRLAMEADIIICAWGVHGTHRDQDTMILAGLLPFLPKLYCLGITKDKHPRHPLYIKGNTAPIPYLHKP